MNKLSNTPTTKYDFRNIDTNSDSEFNIHQKNLTNLKFLMRFKELSTAEQEKLKLKLIAHNLEEAYRNISSVK